MQKACATNYLAARENYQIAKYKLRNTESVLFEKFKVKTAADLEEAILRERSKKQPRFTELTTLYHRQHQELGAADEVFEAAGNLQRQRIAQMQQLDKTIQAMDE
jgi:hypothetical protein